MVTLSSSNPEVVGHAASVRRLVAVLSAIVCGAVGGCGSGGGVASSPPATPGNGQFGRAVITVRWPPRHPQIASRLIPGDSTAIQVTIANQGQKVGGTVLVASAAGGSTAYTFDRLPIGNLTVTATAYPQHIPDAADPSQPDTVSGTPQAAGSVMVTTMVGQTVQIPTITMASTIQSIQIAPPNPSVPVGSTITLMPTAFDASGEMVLVSSGHFKFDDHGSEFLSADSNGVVTGKKVTTAPVPVTVSEAELDSGGSVVTVESVDVNVTVTGAALDHITASSSSVAPGGTATLTAQDQQGDAIPAGDVTWSSDNAGVTVGEAGNPATVTASSTATGTATITATQPSTGKTATSQITVKGLILDHIDASSVTIRPGGTVTVTAKDASGNPIPGSDMSWDTIYPVSFSGGNPLTVTAQPGVSGAVAIYGTQLSTKKRLPVYIYSAVGVRRIGLTGAISGVIYVIFQADGTVLGGVGDGQTQIFTGSGTWSDAGPFMFSGSLQDFSGSLVFNGALYSTLDGDVIGSGTYTFPRSDGTMGTGTVSVQ